MAKLSKKLRAALEVEGYSSTDIDQMSQQQAQDALAAASKNFTAATTPATTTPTPTPAPPPVTPSESTAVSRAKEDFDAVNRMAKEQADMIAAQRAERRAAPRPADQPAWTDAQRLKKYQEMAVAPHLINTPVEKLPGYGQFPNEELLALRPQQSTIESIPTIPAKIQALINKEAPAAEAVGSKKAGGKSVEELASEKAAKEAEANFAARTKAQKDLIKTINLEAQLEQQRLKKMQADQAELDKAADDVLISRSKATTQTPEDLSSREKAQKDAIKADDLDQKLKKDRLAKLQVAYDAEVKVAEQRAKLLMDQYSAEQKQTKTQTAQQQKAAEAQQNQVLKQYNAQMSSVDAINKLANEKPKVLEAISKADPRFLDPTLTQYATRPLPRGYTETTASFNKSANIDVKPYKVMADSQGNVVDTLGKRFKSFGEQLTQNYGEILKWSIAVGLLYGPMQKLNELMTSMIQNQTRLAAVAVTLGASQQETNTIFDQAAVIAAKTGTTIDGVLEGYNLAVRASGDATSSAERYAKANDLLTSSIMLAKISGMDQATATDTLTAAYKQVGDAVSGTQQLLDKWVAVSRTANVDVGTLAASFAIVAESAQAAGLSIDQLNGLIATVSEKTSLSAKETGNSVRAIIAGYSTTGATKELSKYGIAVQDAQGKTRDFMDVVSDVKNQVNQGFISQEGLSSIAYQWGGGNRRQAQTMMAIMGQERMTGVANVSANAPEGIAAKAMETLLATIEGSIAKLGVSFTKLAQALGMEGGLLGAVSAVIDAARVGTDALTGLAKATGGSLPLLAGVGMTGALFRPSDTKNLLAPIIDNITSIFGGIKSSVGGTASSFGQAWNTLGFTQQLQGTQIGQIISGWGSSIGKGFGDYASAYAPAVGVTIASGLFAALQHGAKGDWDSAGIVFGGSIAGGLIGAAGKVAPLGALIGTILAETFVTSLENDKNRIAAAMAAAGAPGGGAVVPRPSSQTPNGVSPSDNLSSLAVAATYGPAGAPSTKSKAQIKAEVTEVQDLSIKFMDEYNAYIQSQENWDKMYAALGTAPKTMDMNTALQIIGSTKVSQGFGAGGVMAPSQLNYGAFNMSAQLTPDITKPYGNDVARLLGQRKDLYPSGAFTGLYQTTPAAQAQDTQTQYSKDITAFSLANRTIIEQLQNGLKNVLKNEFNTGEISQKTLATRREDLSSGPGKAAALAYPLVQSGMDVNKALSQVTELIAKGTDDEISNLVSYSATIQKLNENLAAEKKKLEGTTITNETVITDENGLQSTVGDAQKKIDTAMSDYVDLRAETFTAMINRTVLPSIVDLSTKKFDQADIKKIVEHIPEFIKKQVDELTKLNPAYGQAYQNQQDTSKTALRSITGELTPVQATADLINDVVTYLVQADELIKNKQINQFKITAEQFQNPNSQFNQIYNQIMAKSTALGYTPDLTNFILYTEDKKVLDAIQKGLRVMGMAIDETNDLLSKQLNGVFNLPSGASFYVPYQAAKMSRETDTKVNGKDNLFNTAVDKFARTIDILTRYTNEQGHGKVDITSAPIDVIGKYTNAQGHGEITPPDIQGKYTNEQGHGGTPSLSDQKRYLNEDNRTAGSSALERDISRVLEQAVKNGMVQGLQMFRKFFGLGSGDATGTTFNGTMDTKPAAGLSGAANASINKTTQAKLDIKIDNKVTLVANGRILAEVVKPYLQSDLVTFGNSTSTANANYVVGI